MSRDGNLEFENNRDRYEELLVALEAGSRKLSLLIGVCDDSRLRDEVVDRYESEIEDGAICQRVMLQREKPSLKFLLEELAAAHPELETQERVVVSVLGADRLQFLELEPGQKSELEEFAGYMQWTREGLRDFPFSIVLWVTTNVEQALKQRAQDFWSWRKGVFRFVAKPREFVRKADLASVADCFGKNFQAESTSLIPIDDLEALVAKIEAENPENERLLALYDSLGRNYRERLQSGEYRDYQRESERAIGYFHKALALSPEETEQTAYRLNEMGFVYNSIGQFTEAEPLYQRAFDICERQLGSDHPNTAASLNNLAGVYESQGKYEAAEPLFQRALEIRERQLGGDHPDTASSLNNLAAMNR
ncbi:MAG: tetratricopeptide repeat protein [Geitlerinemataceae cyanobacterium]